MAIDFTMTEEQELLLSSIRELINNEFPEEYFRTHDEEGKYPREFVKAGHDALGQVTSSDSLNTFHN